MKSCAAGETIGGRSLRAASTLRSRLQAAVLTAANILSSRFPVTEFTSSAIKQEKNDEDQDDQADW
jgi:hypothetical protein